ncbi:MAG: galactokinase, partial [Geodermatophilaceae bacterium]|nr:galactokinase [Geodermatophilaceae bacterium]
MTAFTDCYGRPPVGVWAAPGRVNLIGEHTDYNDGFVLPLALQRTVLLAAAPSGTGSRSRSRQQDDTGSWTAATVGPGDVAGWAAYLAGVVWSARAAGHPVRDLDLLVDSDVPLGAGLSSSGALGCAAATALRDLTGVTLDRTAVALLARRSENEFVGAPTGVMDQLASMHGTAGHVVLIDTRSLDVVPIPFAPDRHKLALLLVDTHATHRLVDGQYAQRRASCEQAARHLGVSALRDIDLAGLPAALA